MALAAQSPPRVEDLRERATAYVEQFIARFSRVVAEERLVQESTSLPRVRGSGTNQQMDMPSPQRREIRSDFLFIRRAATDDWNVYRDAFEVDGRRVRDRGDRLMKLLTSSSLTDAEMARRVGQESARYSLNSGGLRTVDDPILALVFLQPGGDSPSRGRLWIDAGTGRVLKSDLQVGASRVETTFAWDEAIGVAVPVEMRDAYTIGRTGFRATATYRRFRRFDVSTSEKVQEP